MMLSVIFGSTLFQTSIMLSNRRKIMTSVPTTKTRDFQSLSDQLRSFLKTELVNLSVSKIEIEDGQDHDGNAVINVVVRHKLINKPLNPTDWFRIDGKARDLAWKLGERRFVHIRHMFNHKQELAA
jgi:hypothetical protein